MLVIAMASPMIEASFRSDLPLKTCDGTHVETVPTLKDQYQELGWSLQDMYKIGLKFFKEKEGSKALQLSYNDRTKLGGLIKQASYGKFRPEAFADVGFLDVVGNDRNQYWQSLGDMPAEEAMGAFLTYLTEQCPKLMPYIQAHQADREDFQQDFNNQEDVLNDDEGKYEELLRIEEKRLKQMKLRKQIRDCLNQQTATQYRHYAKQQLPDNEEEQEVLIGQLQEQHFEQYIEQVHGQQLLHQRQQYYQLRILSKADSDDFDASSEDPLTNNKKLSVHFVEEGSESYETEVNDGILEPHCDQIDSIDFPLINEDLMEYGMPPLIPATMWTRSDIREFKNSVRKNPDNIIKVASLSTATVKVPTHENGTNIFWEFATDSYDIGFGVYFEWTLTPPDDVTVQASESSGEEDNDDDGETVTDKADVEKGSNRKDCGPPMDEIIQIYRRDCHEEVYCGSHTYPGRGVYHLKFDNSYSLWRSKTVYYKIFYSQ